MTKEECHLWFDYLQYYPVKIRKQKVIGCYIVDFYCAAARLVIELDGSQHYTEDGQEKDGASGRTQGCGAGGGDLDGIHRTTEEIDEGLPQFGSGSVRADRLCVPDDHSPS